MTTNMVSVDREQLIALLIEIEAVVNVHNDLAGTSPAPVTEDLDRAAFELTQATFGEVLTDQGEWVGVGVQVDEDGMRRGREIVDAVFGLVAS